MWSCPPEIEEALWTAARQCVGDGALRERAVASAVVTRSRLYTSERPPPGAVGARGKRSVADLDLAARALFFTVADAPKIAVPLAELRRCGLLPTREPLRVLDVGAGTGAMSLGAIASLAPQRLLVRAMDRDAAALTLLQCAVGALPPVMRDPVEMSTRVVDVRSASLPPASFDLVLAGSVLNELEEDARRSLVASLIAAIAGGGALLIIEPALRETSRALHRIRDWVLDEGLASVFAPCIRQLAPCPALADESDWCHEDRPTKLPARTARLARATGLRQHGLKFSYLVLRREDGRLADPPPDGRRALRVVSQLRKLKGRRECFACGDNGRVRLRLLRRNRSAENATIERARRGDVLLLPERDDIAADDRVDVLKL